MVDSILTNQAPVVVRSAENKSTAASATSNASIVPEIEVDDEIIDVSPRTMDTNADESFSSRGAPELRPPLENFSAEPLQLRPALANFDPVEMTSERALENRTADININNNDIDETSTVSNVNNRFIDAFLETDETMQQSVDLTA